MVRILNRQVRIRVPKLRSDIVVLTGAKGKPKCLPRLKTPPRLRPHQFSRSEEPWPAWVLVALEGEKGCSDDSIK